MKSRRSRTPPPEHYERRLGGGVSQSTCRKRLNFTIASRMFIHARRCDVYSSCFFIVVTRVIVVATLASGGSAKITFESPSFSQPVPNNTVALGREAILECQVENLGIYKVAWLRVDTQTILTIHNHVVTKNHRIGVTHSELKIWYLHIREVKESDRGWYMCQINTDPMKSQNCYLDVVVSPDILDFPTSADVVVDEGSDVTLTCVARGFPVPSILWKREDGQLIPTNSGSDIANASGQDLNILRIKRQHMGPYLCIASNGVPPSVSKRIMVVVQFPPSIWIHYQLVGSYDGQQITLECHSEAYPKSINYWTGDNGEIIPHSPKYLPEIIEEGYRVHMKLTLYNLGIKDYGIFRCVSKNSMGEMEGTIHVYRIPHPNNSRNISLRDNQKGGTASSANGVTHKLSSGKDRADLMFREDGYYSCAHQVGVSLLLMYIHSSLCFYTL